MKALFFILIFFVIGTAFWQFFKLLGLTKKDQVATEKENNINGWLMLGLGGFVYGLMLYSMFQGRVVLLPRLSASLEGEDIDNLFVITMGLILVVQFITQFLIYYFTFRYRGTEGRKALFYADSHKLEMWWTITPTVVLSVLIIYGLWTWNNVQDLSDAENPLIIEVYAKQFQWEARYAGEDNQLGLGHVNFIKGINTMGVDMSDKNSADDIPVRELHLPKGRKVIFKFRSQDVMHSAYMPHFRAQINCVPGMVTSFGFTPTVTTEEMRLNEDTKAKFDAINKLRVEEGKEEVEFDYLLLCNKICGASHYNMQMKVVVQEEEDFNKWLKEQKTLAQVINN
ncbi:cytochrome c oxidase subunit II [Lutimonas saemankumensis]|uniref:cytochrome c oxidase subunit II n=1 Tax=Lutimonas saemankumensis TaxID=483016 RepID=UPI001CD28A5F|nr:cytochrome c oxidase subunit II [Lutimonas saemankumensis]MCA0933576.1 cytochrome c oxidase subunit II [Lutimonas saemankumensis]